MKTVAVYSAIYAFIITTMSVNAQLRGVQQRSEGYPRTRIDTDSTTETSFSEMKLRNMEPPRPRSRKKIRKLAKTRTNYY